jgi:hypothetical protein
MPELWPEGTDWDEHNLAHATAHGVSADEIDQVIANGPVYRRNKGAGRQTTSRSASLTAAGGSSSRWSGVPPPGASDR